VAHKQCPNCGHTNPSAAAFCVECGQPLPAGRPCPSCGFTGNPEGATFCVQCGAALHERKRALSPFLLAGGIILILAVTAVVLWQAELFGKSGADGPGSSGERPPTSTPASPTAEEVAAAAPTLTVTPSTPTPSPLPTATPTFPATPSPVPTLPPTPTPLPSPTATPSCQLAADPQLASAWDRGELGCPTAQSGITWAAWQPFQGGYMFWRNDIDGTYVMYFDDRNDRSTGSWDQNPEEWRWDLSDPDGVGMAPPAGLYEPKRGFGWVWRTHLGGPDSSLGWAEDEEKGFCATIQPFDNGLILQSSTVPRCEGDLYNWAIHPSFTPLFFALYDDGTWQRY
jgi:predicted nucleic acid-binding Zn ribbon protein